MPFVVITKWSVLNGGAGTSSMSFDPGVAGPVTQDMIDVASTAVRAFWLAIASRMPSDVTLTFDEEIVNYQANGDIINFWTPTSVPSPVTGGSASAYTAGAGAKVYLHTAELAGGRRIRGGWYVVPVVGSQYTADGVLDSDCTNAILDAADDIQNTVNDEALDLVVWSRKYSQTAELSGISVSNRVAFLSSRKR